MGSRQLRAMRVRGRFGENPDSWNAANPWVCTARLARLRPVGAADALLVRR
jgi:hypothetical protein